MPEQLPDDIQPQPTSRSESLNRGRRLGKIPLSFRGLKEAWSDTLIRNSIFLMATVAVNSLLGYAFWILAARLYPASAVGVAAAITSMLLLFAQIGNLGIYTAFVHRLPRMPNHQAWRSTVTIGLLTGTVASIVAGPIGVLILVAISDNYSIIESNPGAFIAFTTGVTFTVIATLLDYVWVSEREAGKMFLWNGLFSILRMPLLALPAINGLDAEGVLIAWSASQGLICVGEFVQLIRRKNFRPKLSGATERTRSILRNFAEHHLNNMGQMTPLLLMPVLVGTRVSAATVAYFFAAWRIGLFFPMFANATAGSLLAEGAHDRASVPEKVRRSMRIILTGLVPTCIVVGLGAGLILDAFGPGYRDNAYTLLLLLIVAAFPEGIVAIYKSVLRIQDRVVAASMLSWLVGSSALVLSWASIPSLGITGVGWAWLAAQSGGAIAVGLDVARGRLARERGRAAPAPAAES